MGVQGGRTAPKSFLSLLFIITDKVTLRPRGNILIGVSVSAVRD